MRIGRSYMRLLCVLRMGQRWLSLVDELPENRSFSNILVVSFSLGGLLLWIQCLIDSLLERNNLLILESVTNVPCCGRPVRSEVALRPPNTTERSARQGPFQTVGFI